MATRPAAKKPAAKKPAAKKPAAAAKKPAAAAKKPAARATAAKTTAAKPATPPTIPMSKLIAELAEKHDMPKKQMNEIFQDFVDMTQKNLKKGNKIRLTGLGILQVRKRAARMGRNPATGEAIKIKASKKVAFRVAKDLKEMI